ncbi:glycogen debranching protein GlgX [bacterium]|nr:glycogen debranching protein GlgX [bacterium]
MRLRPGRPYPLGATWDGIGVNFALFSEHAEKVELCLFDSPGSRRESERVVLPEKTDQVWHGYLLDVRPGQLFGYRVHGPYDPKTGHRFNAHKVVLDPYARAVGRPVRWCDEMFGYKIGDSQQDLKMDERDNAAFAPLAAVIDPAFTWGEDRHPRTPWHETVIYEMHVKGFTYSHPGVPAPLRGTYAALTTDAAIRHLQDLGITAVELMPIHQHAYDRHLLERGLSNYWGYNTLAYFAPDTRYASHPQPADESVREFKMMVRALHMAGIEVILDVVYNHTGEGNHLGPTLSLRGIDNACYYRLSPEDNSRYTDFTGCGNTLNMMHPRVLQMIMDSLRYWVIDMHVDGFRFDLASALARELFEVNKLGAFFDIIHQDPVLSQVKLIAEPWDLGEGGYQVGNFPVQWTEWNAKYRDTVRRFWRGDGGVVSEFATRLAGSSDLYEQSGRRPYASINFITCHDGFALQDLVSYNAKHNEANKEDGRDGSDDNLSSNCGVEGPTDDPAVRAIRERQKRNFLATLLISQGVPMLNHGDELSRSQRGNNNAYCQDNDVAWLSWNLDDTQKLFLDYVRHVIRLWRRHRVLRRRKFFQGREIRGTAVKDIVWLGSNGKEMTDAEWNAGNVRHIGMLISGDVFDEVDENGERITADTLLALLNADPADIEFKLPSPKPSKTWRLILDTAEPESWRAREVEPGQYTLKGQSVTVFKREASS